MRSDRVSMEWAGVAWLVAWLSLTSCAANHDALTTQQSPATAGGKAGMSSHRSDAGSAEAAPPSFAQVYAMLSMSCGGGKSGCHVGAAPAELAMPDANAAYDHLVDVASTKCAGQMRVVPGDADASVLVQALEGKATCVKAMPLGRDALSEDAIATVRAWIDAGAVND